MEKFNPYNAEGKVKDIELAHEAAKVQDKMMDEDKSMVTGFLTKKGEQDYRTKLGEQDAEKFLDKEIESRNDELRKIEWRAAFNNASQLSFRFNSYQPMESVLTYNDGDTPKQCQLSYLLQENILQSGQLLEILEVEIKGSIPVFTGKLKEEWKEALEKFLKKKVLSEG